MSDRRVATPAMLAEQEAANATAIRFIYEVVLNQAAFDRAVPVIDPAVVDHRGFPGAATGIESIERGNRLNRTAFPDLAFTLETLATSGDTVWVRWTMTGTHGGEFRGRPATGRRVTWQGITQFRMAGGKVVERWLYADDLGLLRQIDGE